MAVPAFYRLPSVGEHPPGSRKAAFCSLHSHVSQVRTSATSHQAGAGDCLLLCMLWSAQQITTGTGLKCESKTEPDPAAWCPHIHC